jgi:hypothetical protein
MAKRRTRLWCMCGRLLKRKGFLLDLAERNECDHVSGLQRGARMTAGPDGFCRTSPQTGMRHGVPLHHTGFPVHRFDRLPSLAIAFAPR